MMKTRNTFSSALMLVALVVGVLTFAAVWNALPVSALKEVEGRPQFGVISLAAGQSARLNVVNTRAVEPDDSGRSLKVTLAFDIYAPAAATDDSGGSADPRVSRQRFLRRESCEVTLRPGEAASFDLIAPVGTRIRAVAYGTPDMRGGVGHVEDPNIRTTLEVQESGRTTFVLSPAAVLLGEVDG